ncbi:TRAP transporter small permease subunit [Desulfocurvus vexinensis]|uniref:TRAP transporter small permease subunit n=1 Tax=Desulfocurvus vexinensis TaxID=399548 RepID=UPI0004920FCA|nr:TRAP transporter small permease subunit [Desulfocurvus vexinensis]
MLDALLRAIDKTTQAAGGAAKLLSLLLVLVVAADVALRYFFSYSNTALRELEWHAFAALFLLGGAYTLLHDDHVRVDVFYQRFSRRTRALINVLGCLVFLFPGCWLVIETSIPFVKFSLAMHEISPDPGGLPARWVLKALIPLGFGLLALQGVAFLMRNLFVLTGRTAPRKGR